VQLYWLRQSIPELADLPKEVRRRVYFNALRRSPGLTAAFVLLVCCLYFASFVPALLIARDVIGARGLWAEVAVGCVCNLVTFALSWIIGLPILFHFLRPQLRLAREADESQRRSTH
jgi:hypothetical protein